MSPSPKSRCTAQVPTRLLCIAVTDLLLEVNTGWINPAMLADDMARHCPAHAVAYGYAIFVPKHNFMLHLPRQIAQLKFLVACWVHERKHKIVKRWAVPLCMAKQRSDERGLLEECTRAHMH